MPRPRPTPGRRRLSRVEETSAGGVVLDRSGEELRVALIGRLNRHEQLLWSLPKGHVEAGESAAAAAVREVEEETGIQGRVVGRLGTIDFWFVAESRRIHKTVHHFLLVAEGGELSDADVEVATVAWVPLDRVADQLAYQDERGLLAKVPKLLPDLPQ